MSVEKKKLHKEFIVIQIIKLTSASSAASCSRRRCSLSLSAARVA